MLIQERIKERETILKLNVAIDDEMKEIYQASAIKQMPKDERGQKPRLSNAEIITILIMGAWLGLQDKAKLYYQIIQHYRGEFPGLVSYSKFVEASNRVIQEVGTLLGRMIARNRVAQGEYPVVFQDSSAAPVCKISRAKQHKTFRAVAHKSKTAMGWYYGFKIHIQCDQEGRICGFRFTAANVDDRKLLEPMTNWIEQGIVVGDKGYISADKAYSLGQRNIQLIAGARKNMKKMATQFQIAATAARHRVEEVFQFLKCSFGLIRSTHRADYALPIHFIICLLAYSFFKLFIA